MVLKSFLLSQVKCKVHLGSMTLAKPLSATNMLWPVKYKLSVPHTLGLIEIIGT